MRVENTVTTLQLGIKKFRINQYNLVNFIAHDSDKDNLTGKDLV